MLLRTIFSVDPDGDSTFGLKEAARLIVERAGLSARDPGLSEPQWQGLEGAAKTVAVRTCIEAALTLKEAGNTGGPFIRLIRVAALTSGLAEMGGWNTDEALEAVRRQEFPSDYVDAVVHVLQWGHMGDPECDWTKQEPDEGWTLTANERLGVEQAINEIRGRVLLECIGIVSEFAD